MPCFHPVSVPSYKLEDGMKVRHYHLVPCGKCADCLLQQQKQWAFRIEQEVLSGKYVSTLFVTFTYDNKHLPSDGSLSKIEVQKYLHDLRQNIDRHYSSSNRPYLTYYFCGEYGSRFGRPHYHAILMFTRPVNFKFIQTSWNKGIVDIRPFIPACAGYVAKYSLKQIGQEYDGKTPPFRLASKGIGSCFLQGRTIQSLRYNPYYTNLSGYKIKLPRYYIEKLTKGRKVFKYTFEYEGRKFSLSKSFSYDLSYHSMIYRDKRERLYWDKERTDMLRLNLNFSEYSVYLSQCEMNREQSMLSFINKKNLIYNGN